VDAAHREALRGNYWLALTLNGAAYARALNLDSVAADRALEAGAIAAGVSGKGPAVAAIVPSSNLDDVLSSWSPLPGLVIETSFNHKKANARKMAS
jgi:shikimate kinase